MGKKKPKTYVKINAGDGYEHIYKPGEALWAGIRPDTLAFKRAINIKPEELVLCMNILDKVTIDETELDCITVSLEDPDGNALKFWYCAAIPVDGLVRVEREGDVVVELVEWGTSDD